jgi:hypothetical protein
LLGLSNCGYPSWKIPLGLIKLAFKRQTMWNHPDKKSRGDWTDEDREVPRPPTIRTRPISPRRSAAPHVVELIGGRATAAVM